MRKNTHTHIETHYCRGDVSSLSGVVRKLNFIVIGFFSGFYFDSKTLFSIIRVTFAYWPCFAITKIYNVHICMYINDAYKQTQITTTSLTLTKNKNCYDGHLGRAAQSASLPQSLGKGSMLN